MKILTKQSNSCRYFVKQLPLIDQGWSIFSNNYFCKIIIVIFPQLGGQRLWCLFTFQINQIMHFKFDIAKLLVC